MNETNISIVIPVRNGEKYIDEAIASAVEQERPADEIVIVDNASTDKTAGIVKSSRWKDKLKYFYYDTFFPPYDSWNRAVKNAKGDFIVFLSHDDGLHYEYIKYIRDAIDRFPKVRVFFTGCHYIDSVGNIIGSTMGPHSTHPVYYPPQEYAHNYLLGVYKNNHIHRIPGPAINRNLLMKECPFRETPGGIMDDDFFYRIGLYTDAVGISQPLASYRIHSESDTGASNSLSLRLAQHYVFQSRFYKENKNHLFEYDDILIFHKLAVKFINLLLFQSLLYKRNDLVKVAFKLRSELDEMLPTFMEKELPLWARIMWKNMKQRESNFRTALYVKTLHAAINMRDHMKAYLGI